MDESGWVSGWAVGWICGRVAVSWFVSVWVLVVWWVHRPGWVDGLVSVVGDLDRLVDGWVLG